MVSDDDVPHFRLHQHKNTRQFEADVRFAQSRTIDYQVVVHHRRNGTRLPPNRFLFTFDDGFSECFQAVRPILRRYGVSGLFFVSTDFIDNRVVFYETKISLCITAIIGMDNDRLAAAIAAIGVKHSRQTAAAVAEAREVLSTARIDVPLSKKHRLLLIRLLSLTRSDECELDRFCESLGVDAAAYARERQIFMTSDQIMTLAADGCTIGGHGLDHRSLQRMTPDQIEHQIVSSCRIVRELSGQKRVPFAFPYSGRGIDRGFLAGVISRHPFIELLFDSGPLSRDEPFVVDRVWAEDPIGARVDSNLPALMRRAWSTPSAWFRS